MEQQIHMNNEEKRYDNAKIYCVSVRPLKSCFEAGFLYGMGAAGGIGATILIGQFMRFICSLVGLEIF